MSSYGYNGFGELNADTPSGGATVGINYDALGRAAMTNVNGGSYTEFIYAPDGSKLALMNGQTLSKARVELPGGGTAVYDPTGLIRYWHSDWEGSIRLLTNPSQPTYYSSAAAAPYGESYAENPSGAGALFASLLGDTSSELADATFREYNPTEGRWMNPDPAGLAAVDLTNPQSLNRYAYTGNNPTTLVDPLGLGPQPQPQPPCGAPGTVPQGYSPSVWCYNHMGIAGGSSPGAFFTNTADEFDLIGLVLAAGNQGSYYYPCPNGDCGWKTQPIFTPQYSPADLADLLNALLVLPNGVTYEPGKGLNSPPPKLPPGPLPDWGTMPPDPGCTQQALQQDFGPNLGGFVSTFSVYKLSGNYGVTIVSEVAKYGLLGVGRVLGVPAVTVAGETVAGASAAATVLATTMDARTRYECGEPVLP